METIKLLKNIILVIIIAINTMNHCIDLKKISRRWPTEEPLRITLLRNMILAKNSQKDQPPGYHHDELFHFRQMGHTIDRLVKEIFGEAPID